MFTNDTKEKIMVKECLNNMQTSRIYLNQDNFQNRLFNGDILETSPMIHNSNYLIREL